MNPFSFTLHRGPARGVALVIVGLVAAACGSSATTDGAGSTTLPSTSAPTASTTPTAAATTATVRAATIPPLGTVLVNGAGRTLYLFTPDKQSTVTCTGACAQAWPPLVVAGGTAIAGTGVEASLLGTVKDPDGQTQITYNHWPLYTFSGDAAAGQAKGQALDGTWFALTVAGTQAISPSAVTTTTVTGGGGAGF